MSRSQDQPGNILIISNANDAHIPFVKEFLSSPTIVIDPTDILRGARLSYQYIDGSMMITFNDEELCDIKSVWYRKPTPVWGDELPVDARYQRYSLSSIQAFTRELYMHFRNALWISDYYAIRKADYKGLQQAIAGELGFNIPDTLMTSDQEIVKEFITNHDKVIVKSMASSFPFNSDGYPTMFFSSQVENQNDIDLDNLALAPAIFQQVINVQYEIRVTVVGDNVFAAKIEDNKNQYGNIRDWRYGNLRDNISISSYELPQNIKLLCAKLTQRLELRYGAIDLIRDLDGIYWFLEINPNGQWAFVEEHIRQPIGKSIADLLEKGVAT